jgi:hypothetical protein
MTDNYIDVSYEYFGTPDEEGNRPRFVDVWYATKPTAPQFSQVDNLGEAIIGHEARINTAWTLEKAGLDRIHIFDRDDVAGLRLLLDRLDAEFDRRDLEELHKSLDTDEEDE